MSAFLDVAAAKARARLESDHKKAVRRAADAANLLSAAELAALLPAYEGGCRCPRCDRDGANLLSGRHHCWDCEAEVRELFESEGVDHV